MQEPVERLGDVLGDHDAAMHASRAPECDREVALAFGDVERDHEAQVVLEAIQPLFITVDPKRDTPPVVKQYVAAFGSGIRGLTGTPAEIANVAKEYRVYYAERPAESGAAGYSVDHSSVLYLMDPKGGFLAPVRADQSGAEIAANLKKLTG